MNKKNAITSLLLLTLPAGLFSCNSVNSIERKTKDMNATQIYSEAKSRIARGSYKDAAEYLSVLEGRYPSGQYAIQAQLDTIYAYYLANKPEEALSAADRFISLYPDSPLTEYAYYMKGVINYNRSTDSLDRFIPYDQSQRDPGSALEAFGAFSELIKKFPNSKYSDDARQRMLFLRDTLARSELNIANYYMKRKAYVAAIERANWIIEHYQRTSAVEPALRLLEEAYTNMGMTKLAADARRVRNENRRAGNLVDHVEDPGKPLMSRLWSKLKLDE